MENNFEKFFLEEKCDKHYHGYHKWYDKIIGYDISSILEIGVYFGDSLRAWKKIWPDVKIEGIEWDNTLIEKYKLDDKCKIYNIDSKNTIQSSEIKNTYDIIVDDATHDWKSQLETFNNFYDKAKKFYVIEDIQGPRSLSYLISMLPKNILDKAMVFDSLGTRSFTIDGTKIREHYKIMIISK